MNLQFNSEKKKRYWPIPSIIQSVYEYQDVNNDKNLQKDVTDFFYNKLVSWIDNDTKFKKYEYLKKDLETKEGKKFIYKLLKHFIINSNINWYDLRDNYSLVKKYIYIKIKSFNH